MNNRPENIDDLCPRPQRVPPSATVPLATPIYLSAAYECENPEQASAMLAGTESGYVYQRDRHPNADVLAEKCRALHGAERAAITSSGMSALSLALLALLETGDHVVVSNQLYGRSLVLLTMEAARLGITSTVVDTCDLAATTAACGPRTRMIVVESITNPLLRVSDFAGLSAIAKKHDARLLVDNTFAGPALCRPLELGADLVLESLTKTMNGHSDVVLGLLCGRAADWQRMPSVQSSWGLAAAPFDCWLALRGIGTLAVRIERAAANAQEVAGYLAEQKGLSAVYYPGLPKHPDHELARRQFACFGTMVSFTLPGGTAAAARFMAGSGIPFCPSLGDLCTTLSHPESTSHRGLTAEARAGLGIAGGTLRLSVGIESSATICDRVAAGLAACR